MFINRTNFKTNSERKEFLNSGFSQFLINNQVKCLNRIMNGDKSALHSFYQSIFDFMCNLMYIDHDIDPTLHFEDLNPCGGSTCGLYKVYYREPINKIILDERFLYLMDYPKHGYQEFTSKFIHDDNSMLLEAILTLTHEFQHNNQDVLASSKHINKTYLNKYFSKQTISTFKNRDNPTLTDNSSSTIDFILDFTCEMLGKHLDEILLELSENDSENFNYFDEAESLTNLISSFEYMSKAIEIEARKISYDATINLLKTWQTHPKLNKKAKKFIGESIASLSNPDYIRIVLERLPQFSSLFRFMKIIKSIDKDKLFGYISNCFKKEVIKENSVNVFAYILKIKGMDTIKDFFEYTINNSPSEHSFLVIEKAIKSTANHDKVLRNINNCYYKFLTNKIEPSLNHSLKSEQIYSPLLKTSQQIKLLKTAIENNQLNYILKLFTTSYVPDKIVSNEDYKKICKLIENYYTDCMYNNECYPQMYGELISIIGDPDKLYISSGTISDFKIVDKLIDFIDDLIFKYKINDEALIFQNKDNEFWDYVSEFRKKQYEKYEKIYGERAVLMAQEKNIKEEIEARNINDLPSPYEDDTM